MLNDCRLLLLKLELAVVRAEGAEQLKNVELKHFSWEAEPGQSSWETRPCFWSWAEEAGRLSF